MDDAAIEKEGAHKRDGVAVDCKVNHVADDLESSGFIFRDRTPVEEIDKLVGYKVIQKPAELRVPIEKSVLMARGLLELTLRPVVDINVLRALV